MGLLAQCLLLNFWEIRMNALNLPDIPTNLPQLLALAAALGWASGVRLYLVVLIVGLAGIFGWVPLPQGLHVLTHPGVIAASSFMVLVEFFADKIPIVDTLWDVVHTVIRIPAGAALAASVFGADNSTLMVMSAVLGGTLAATAHATKATTRAVINTSPEPFSNIGASLVEDTSVVGGIWLALSHPLVFIGVLSAAIVLSFWLLIHFWRFLALLMSKITGMFSGRASGVSSATGRHP
jgi:hypothetical protein